MKKLYSIVLMAAALLIGTNAWAETYTVGTGEGSDYANFAAFWTAKGASLTSADEIKLTSALTLPTTGGTWDFNGAVVDCGAYRFTASKVKTYTLQNVTFKNITGKNGFVYVSTSGTVNLENVTISDVPKYYGVRLANGATLNVDASSNIVAKGAGVWVSAGTATIVNEGTISTGFVVADGATANITNNGTFTQAVSVVGAFNLENNGTATITAGTFSGAVSFTGTTPVEINDGTFNGQLSGSNITIHGGTFNVAPTATGTISPVGLCKFEEGVGTLDIADGYTYRAYDKQVVLSNAGQVEVTHANGQTETMCIEEAFANIANGDEITLLEDVISYAQLWLGTAAKDGAYKSVTLDLNGHTLSSHKDVRNTIWLTHGALYIVNSVPGQGGIVNNYTGKASQVVLLHGSPDRSAVNPRTAAVADLFTYLLIDEGVTLSATGSEGNGFSVDVVKSGLDYQTDVYNCAASSYGVAYGVRVDMKGTIDATKYAGKVNGYVRHPNEMIEAYPCVTDVQIGDTANSTFVHIFPSAIMHTANTSQATAVYCSGYARWQIQGLCQGANGVYVKSGVVDLTDAVIESTYTGDASITTGKSSGVEATGYGVVVESNVHYTGQQALVIGGDTKIETPANDGAAVIDVVDATHETKVESIVINGGSFTGENAIVVSAETASEQTTQINGVTIQGDITVGGSTAPEAIADIMGSNTHTTEIENADGSKTVVISAGEAPAAATEWVDVAALTPGSNAKWTGFTAGVIANGATVNLGELQIISADGTTGKELQQLTIENGAVLNVERLIMNDYARIIVEAGGKLIVSGTQGINAPVVDNILLKTSETAQAHFLFHPSVSSNRHPSATVEFTSKSYRQSGKNVYQRFGIPSYTNDVQLEYKDKSSSTLTYIQMWDYVADAWTESWIAVPAATGLNVGISGPFGCFDLASNNAKNAPMTYLFKGGLVGNDDASMVFNNKFNPYANSYMAPIDIKTLVDRIADNYPELSASVYVYRALANDNYTWTPLAQANFNGWDEPEVTEIAPMQAYMLYMIPGNSSNATVSYKDNVYDPYMAAIANPAPARRAKAAKKNFLKLNIADENGIVFDNARILEDNQFSAEFDNGYDINKYMNEKVSLYVTSQDEAWNTLASDDVLNTYLGVNVAESGVYTISVAHNGLDYALIDLENNQVIDLVEGNSYNFYQEAGQNDARFQLVAIHKVPTALDNVQNDVLSTKFMKDGVLYILKNGVLYNAQGQMVK